MSSIMVGKVARFFKYQRMKWRKLIISSTMVGENFEMSRYEMAKISHFCLPPWMERSLKYQRMKWLTLIISSTMVGEKFEM